MIKYLVKGAVYDTLLSKVCRRIEEGIAACLYKGKAQPTTCWGCGRWDMSYGAVQIKRRGQERQKCSK